MIDRSIYSLKKIKHVQNLITVSEKSIAMKKQTELLTKTLTTPIAGRIECVFLIIIAAIFYRSQGNRRMSFSMPPNTLGYAKQAMQSVLKEAEKLVSKMAGFFYNGSFDLFQLFAITTLILLLVIAIVHVIRTN